MTTTQTSPTKTPHHATAALARKFGIALTANSDDTWVAAGGDGRFTSTAATAKEAVAQVIAQMPKPAKAAKPRKAKKTKGKKKDGKAPRKSGVMAYHYYKQYRENGGTCGDDLAEALTEECTVIDTGKSGKAKRRKLDHAALMAVAKENNLPKDLLAKWEKLNPGMVRMNLGNVLRAKGRDGEKVMVGGHKVHIEPKEED